MSFPRKRESCLNMKQYYVYILTNRTKTTLYIGITSDLCKRILEHKGKFVEGFTKKYNVDCLVYYEIFFDPESAILREKRIKKWNRKWKWDLIKEKNPELIDLYKDVCGN